MDTETTGTEPTPAEVKTEAPSEGTQPPVETSPTPAPETQGSEPTIPYSRFNEVLRERNELRNRLQQPTPVTQAQDVAAPKQEQFETYEAYVEARASHAAEKAAERRFNDLQERQRAQWQQQQEQARESKAGSNFGPKWQAEVTKDPNLAKLSADHIRRNYAQLCVSRQQDFPLRLYRWRRQALDVRAVRALRRADLQHHVAGSARF